jgi:hypothetical protein
MSRLPWVPFIVIILLTAAPPLFAAQHFTEVTGPAGVGMSGLGAAAAFGDFSGDGLPDLVISRNYPDYSVFVYTNDGDGTFTDVSGSCGVNGYLGSLTMVDFDGDGDLDLAGESGDVVVYRNDGAGTFTNVTAALGLGDVPASKVLFFDYDNDGELDLFAAGYDCRLFRNTASAFSEVTAAAGLASATADWSAAAFDYDNDGRLDLYLPNDPQSALWRNEGDGSFSDVTAQAGVSNPGSDPSGLDVGDYNGDGWLDIYICNIGELPFEPDYHRLYRNNGDGTFSDVTGGAGVACYGDGRGAWFIDYDRDGRRDIFAASHVSDNAMYRNDGDGTFTDTAAALNIDKPWDSFGVAWSDFDLDGDLDVYLAGHFDNRLLRNDEAPGGYLCLNLVGVESNTAAVGARVRVTLDDGECWDQRTAGGGLHGDEDPTLEFGLGDDDAVDLRIWWPSGLVEDYLAVPADSRLTITEGEGLEYAADEVVLDGRAVDDGLLLEWTPESGEGLSSWSVRRDGVELVELPGDAGRFLDRAATPGITYGYELVGRAVDGRELRRGSLELTRPSDAARAVELSPPWPCPATEVVKLSFDLPPGRQGTLSVYDTAGRRVIARELAGSGVCRLAIGELATGCYLVELKTAETRMVRRLVVRRRP